jgi:hypothetical protein
MLVLVIVLATAAFAVGSALERAQHYGEETSVAISTPSGESAAGHAAESGAPNLPPSTQPRIPARGS